MWVFDGCVVVEDMLVCLKKYMDLFFVCVESKKNE